LICICIYTKNPFLPHSHPPTIKCTPRVHSIIVFQHQIPLLLLPLDEISEPGRALHGLLALQQARRLHLETRAPCQELPLAASQDGEPFPTQMKTIIQEIRMHPMGPSSCPRNLLVWGQDPCCSLPQSHLRAPAQTGLLPKPTVPFCHLLQHSVGETVALWFQGE
jgi:hypothetical protein